MLSRIVRRFAGKTESRNKKAVPGGCKMTDRTREDVLGEGVVESYEELRDERINTDDMARVEPAVSQREDQKELEAQHSDRASLLAKNAEADFRTQWDNIQTSFVDEPRKAVEQADSLVAQVMQHIARTFSDERKNLEAQWSRGDNVSTEDLRIALQRYRTFFSRLLSV